MNRSGYAARCLAERHGLEVTDLLVVYDEVALPLGRLRMRSRGGPGGHRGMESVIANLKSDRIARLRLGIGAPDGAKPDDDLSDYVLEPFRADEREAAEEMIERAADAVERYDVGNSSVPSALNSTPAAKLPNIISTHAAGRATPCSGP